jgi:hypothetical protein
MQMYGCTYSHTSYRYRTRMEIVKKERVGSVLRPIARMTEVPALLSPRPSAVGSMRLVNRSSMGEQRTA